jgi:hypothetical protein
MITFSNPHTQSPINQMSHYGSLDHEFVLYTLANPWCKGPWSRSTERLCTKFISVSAHSNQLPVTIPSHTLTNLLSTSTPHAILHQHVWPTGRRSVPMVPNSQRKTSGQFNQTPGRTPTRPSTWPRQVRQPSGPSSCARTWYMKLTYLF